MTPRHRIALVTTLAAVGCSEQATSDAAGGTRTEATAGGSGGVAGAGGTTSAGAGTAVGGAGGAAVPPCPTEPPAHGSPCEPGISYSCSYDDCAQNNAKVEATCVAGTWQAHHSLCEGPGCATLYEDVFCFEPNTLCVVETVEAACTPHPAWACPENPCQHEPLSCACAGVLCGPFLECVETESWGNVLCGLPPPEPNPAVPLVEGYSGYDLVLTDQHAYWTGSASNTTGVVVHVKLQGNNAVDTFSTIGSSPRITLDSTHLYVGDSSGTLRRYALTNNPTEEILATGLPAPQLWL